MRSTPEDMEISAETPRRHHPARDTLRLPSLQDDESIGSVLLTPNLAFESHQSDSSHEVCQIVAVGCVWGNAGSQRHNSFVPRVATLSEPPAAHSAFPVFFRKGVLWLHHSAWAPVDRQTRA